MARSRRGSVPRGTRRMGRVMREPRPDWVYNGESYTGAGEDLPAGLTNARAIVLVDSLNVQRRLQYGQVDFLGTQTANASAIDVVGSWQYPEGRRNKVIAVQGLQFFVPSSWTLGTTSQICARLLVLPQDALTGAAVLDSPFYTAWGPSGATGNPMAKWANERRLLKEWRWSWSFDSNVASPIFTMRYFARVKWTLKPEDGLFLYLEQSTGSATVRFSSYMRTLMVGQR